MKARARTRLSRGYAWGTCAFSRLAAALLLVAGLAQSPLWHLHAGGHEDHHRDTPLHWHFTTSHDAASLTRDAGEQAVPLDWNADLDPAPFAAPAESSQLSEPVLAAVAPPSFDPETRAKAPPLIPLRSPRPPTA